MAKEDVGHYAAGQEEEEEDVTLSTNPLLEDQQPLRIGPSSPPGPFHPSLLPRSAEPTTPRWGALAIMALALLALEASILLGVTDVWSMWGGGGGFGVGGGFAGGGRASAEPGLGGGESCQAPAGVEAAGAAAGPFSGLRQWMGEQHEVAALWKRYNDVVNEYEGFLEEREKAGGAHKAKGWTLLSAR